MLTTPHARVARWIVLLVPALLLAGAYVSELVYGLYPCEMCWWQRYPHFAAVGFALVSFVAPPRRMWLSLGALAILASGLIGAFHAGVEYGWWEGITGCATAPGSQGGDALEAIMNAPLVRCDVAPWSLLGISLAGYNFLISTGAAMASLALLGTQWKAQ